MKKIISAILIIALVLGIPALLAGCGKDKSAASGANNDKPEAQKLVKVRFANLKPAPGDAFTHLAIEKGIYAKYGIELEVVNFIKGGAEALAGAASGQVDLGSFGTPILTGIAKGIPIKVLASPADKDINFVLVGANNIKTVQDLKGKTVATGALGGGSHQSFLRILAANGLRESYVKVVATGGTDAELILKSGKVDAVITTEPTVTKIENEKAGHTLVKAKDVYGRYQHTYIFVNTKFADENPEVVRNFLKAYKESIIYAREHQEELIALAKKKLKLDEGLLRDYYKKTIPDWDDSGKVDVEGMLNAIKILQDLGEIDKNAKISADTLLDSRFAQ